MRYLYFFSDMCTWCNDAKPVINRLKEKHCVVEFNVKDRKGLSTAMLHDVHDTPVLLQIGPDGYELNRYDGDPSAWDI